MIVGGGTTRSRVMAAAAASAFNGHRPASVHGNTSVIGSQECGSTVGLLAQEAVAVFVSYTR